MVERSDEWLAGYEVGYREGGSSRDADYWLALDDLLDKSDLSPDMSPQRVVALVRRGLEAGGHE